MAAKPPPETLRNYINYDPLTGNLTWKRRSIDMCSSEKEQKRFNTRWAGKPATSISVSSERKYISKSVHFKGGVYRSSHIAWALHHGAWPTETIDHINHDATDDSAANMREVSLIENRRNYSRQINNTSGVPGVSWSKQKGKWKATIKAGGKERHLLLTDDFDEAVKARKQAEAEMGYHKNFGNGYSPYVKLTAGL